MTRVTLVPGELEAHAAAGAEAVADVQARLGRLDRLVARYRWANPDYAADPTTASWWATHVFPGGRAWCGPDTYVGSGSILGSDGRRYPLVVPEVRHDGALVRGDADGSVGVATLGGRDPSWVTTGVQTGTGRVRDELVWWEASPSSRSGSTQPSRDASLPPRPTAGFGTHCASTPTVCRISGRSTCRRAGSPAHRLLPHPTLSRARTSPTACHRPGTSTAGTPSTRPLTAPARTTSDLRSRHHRRRRRRRRPVCRVGRRRWGRRCATTCGSAARPNRRSRRHPALLAVRCT